jgi:Ser/Thr protein kinase RdoA (MazF antagonist)
MDVAQANLLPQRRLLMTQMLDLEQLTAFIGTTYAIDTKGLVIQTHGAGLINETLILTAAGAEKYILQRINTHVFKSPQAIAQNISIAAQHLKAYHPDYLFVAPIQSLNGADLVQMGAEWWRLTPYISDTICVQVASNADQAYEAAQQFGRLTANLADCAQGGFQQTIPHFHEIGVYRAQLQAAVAQAKPERIKRAQKALASVNQSDKIGKIMAEMDKSAHFKQRMMHHDAKLGNVLLLKETEKGVCVIDLDTLMPGKIYSDLGDLIRSSVCACNEDEAELDMIEVRKSYLQAAIEGYRTEMHDQLTSDERKYLEQTGQGMVYMQAIRFLADYLRGDTYYKVRDEWHNLQRAENQLEVLRQLVALGR